MPLLISLVTRVGISACSTDWDIQEFDRFCTQIPDYIVGDENTWKRWQGTHLASDRDLTNSTAQFSDLFFWIFMSLEEYQGISSKF